MTESAPTATPLPAHPPATTESAKTDAPRAAITVDESVLERAIEGDKKAVLVMFRQFIEEKEKIFNVEYLGRHGAMGIGRHSFGCISERRVASIKVGWAGEVSYQDAWIEGINSSVFYQPSLKQLYIGIFAVFVLGSIPLTLGIVAAADTDSARQLFLGVGAAVLTWVLGAPIAFLFYHWSVKSGLVFIVREGLSVYMFTNRKRLQLANAMWRLLTPLRERRIKQIGPDR